MDAVEDRPGNATKHTLYCDLSVLAVVALSRRNVETAPASTTLTGVGAVWVFMSHLPKQRLLCSYAHM